MALPAADFYLSSCFGEKSLGTTSPGDESKFIPFPVKLYNLLLIDSEKIGLGSDVCYWNEAGDEFTICDTNKFSTLLLPMYFRTNKLSSFQRQMRSYGFKRLNRFSRGVYVYSNSDFHRDHPERLPFIQRAQSRPSVQRMTKKQDLILGATNARSDEEICTPLSIPNFSLSDWDSEKETLKR
eukprot:CAMPEP_0194199944 /NCGR_PEP_ID=MMETSP0156-20130528/767_1 /TAXON_ID=33649 /ORGANISM="Thalassionema nitzschioides, Strain L26-B" /LENGTH=181 /DNA_ID=CAMNT_0038924897 /DNA_START=18 /DNA_END=563 /DNA_ORIENTATION=+